MSTSNGGRNPLLPAELHIPDPEARVMPDGRVWVYGSWDQHDDCYCSDQYCTVSSPDMRTWTTHGVSFEIDQVLWTGTPEARRWGGVDWANPTPFLQSIYDAMPSFHPPEAAAQPMDLLFAPDAVHRDGRYYLYFCGSDESVGVAVADRPGGPFVDPIQLPCGGIDPAVFVDDDGQAYLYWGQFSAHAAKLASDMSQLIPGSQIDGLITEEGHHFHEGSSLRKRNDTYYLVYTSMERGKATCLSYATSRTPLGPFVHQGVIVDNAACDPKSWNNHGSIECVDGRWYVFYHRSSRASERWRRLCVEPIEFDEDGRIAEVVMSSQGAGRPFALGEPIEAWRACEVRDGAWIGPDRDGDESLHLTPGAGATFRWVGLDRPSEEVLVQAAGTGYLELVARGREEHRTEIHLSESGPVSSPWPLPEGRYEIELTLLSGTDVRLSELVVGRGERHVADPAAGSCGSR